MATATQTVPQSTKLELRTAYGPVYRDVLTLPPRESTSEEIPVIDIAGIYGDFEARKELAKCIKHAAETTGFFYIKNHGIDDKVIQSALDQAKIFFHQPDSEKEKVSKNKSKYFNGWSQRRSGHISPTESLDYREGFGWRYAPQYDPDPKDPGAVPEEVRPYIRGEEFVWEGTTHLPGFQRDCIKYWQECLKLARRLVKIFALCLDLPEDYFDKVTSYPGSDGVFNYYPKMTEAEVAASEDVGLGSHTDLQCFTLLWQDMIGGLQVLNKDGQWIKATPIEGTIVVNIGDYLMRLSNDRFKSTVHRVYNRSTVDRYSMPFFFGFNFNENGANYGSNREMSQKRFENSLNLFEGLLGTDRLNVVSTRLLRGKKIKNRIRKACYPCQGNSPVTSAYTEGRPPKQARTSREPTLENVVHNYRSPSDRRTSASIAPSPGTPMTPAEIPNRSIASLVQDRATDTRLVGVSSMLGLENQTASYLFIKASDSQERWRQLSTMLPTQKEVLKYFGFFKALALPFNPALIDPEEFEGSVLKYVEDIAQSNPSRFESDKAIAWTALILAVLANGVQLSDLSLAERSRLSRDYARKSFHCLRLVNFLMRPSEEVLQALLLLAQILQNDQQAFSAWSLLGTTIRLAQSLGLDIRQRNEHERDILVPRYRKLWRAVFWQDTILSLCLGRPPSALYRASIAQPPWDGYNLCYFDCMFCLCDIVMHMIDPVTTESRNAARALSDVESCERLFSIAAPHLQAKENCRNLRDRMEFYALRLHVTFTVSYVCQMALRKIQGDTSAEILGDKLKQSLIASLRAFLSLGNLSVVPIRGWSFVHHALSSALLLGIIGETKSSTEVKALQESLISVLSSADIESDSSSSNGGQSTADGSRRFTNRHAKALEALQAMCSHASKGGSPIPHEQVRGDIGSVLVPAVFPDHFDLMANGQWDVSQPEVIRSPNGTFISPGTFWDSLFADSTVVSDIGGMLPHPQQDFWGL
ncbi:putative 2og-fe oxygenase superfamily protein [Phaeomoniella chlamydospora]|uniref:Putative 2og-fe oxygenase superfamily protein n=1 Tax=Phaeomoniella chlamydospora TaxID=158046 RepID=A0A0G2ECY5_PHACM|nr:putative 2og-fe oxygenase superfamily protein [Phaeomoniella chlamydospora]